MRIVVKVGTSTLAYTTGRLNIRHTEQLVKVLSDLKNEGHEVILVSSGAIGMGVGKLSLPTRPKDTTTKQACAAVGQCELMYTYDRLFTACDHHQKLIRNLVSVLANKILLFNDKITHVSKRTTREKLLSYLSVESIRQSSLSFDIPFDRQQLADFLCVERAAMSVELSKLQREGLLVTKRNHFELLTR